LSPQEDGRGACVCAKTIPALPRLLLALQPDQNGGKLNRSPASKKKKNDGIVLPIETVYKIEITKPFSQPRHGV
jgi:hypothetical protein